MSRGFVKEGDQEEVPMILPRAFLPSGVTNYVTPEGLRLLHDEMESLKEEWSAAGSNYVTKNYLDAKMRLLSERINSAVLIDNTKANPDVVSFGMYVKYNDKVIRIVGVDEADASKGLISFISPIAKALIGKKKDDKFEIKVPRGTETVEIQEVATFISTELRTLSPEQSTDTETVEVIKKIVQSPQQKFNGQKPIASSQQPNSPSTSSGTNAVTEPVEVAENTAHGSQLTAHGQKTFKPQDAPTDFLPLVNEQGNIVGRALHCQIHNGNKVLHPAVHLLVYNTKKEIVAKYWWHVAFGETAEKTLKRKISDITSGSIKPKFKKQYIREDKNEKELVSVFTAVCDGEIHSSQCDKDYDKIFEKSVV